MNTSTILVVVAVGSILLAAFAAAGAHVLREFSRRQLEIYCTRRRRRDRFGEILSGHDDLAETASMLWILATCVGFPTIGILGVQFAWFPLPGVEDPRFSPLQCGGLAIVTLLSAVVVFHWIPLGMARFWSAPFLFHTWIFWRLLGVATLPLTWIGERFESLLGQLGGKLEEEPDEEEAFEEEIRTMVTAGQREGLLERDAREMIEGVIEMSDREVSDIMTPRSHVDVLNADLPWKEVLEFVIEVGRTRIPVHEGSLDNIIGILYVKDLLSEFTHDQPDKRTPWLRLLREALMVPTTKPVDDMLREFLSTRNHMAIVLDEYRSVAGVVTIEDALEEIVGEINDESDDEEEEIRLLGEAAAEAVGYAHLEDINEKLGLNLPQPEELDTIGGLVIHRSNAIPAVGEAVTVGNVRITVLEASRRSVERVRLDILETTEGDALEDGEQEYQSAR